MNQSDAAALAFVAGGLAATVAAQALTEGQHSVTRGLRQHPWLFAAGMAVFTCHVFARPRRLAPYDPFHILAPVARGIGRWGSAET